MKNNFQFSIFNFRKDRGFTLFVAILIMGTILLVGTGIVNLALKQVSITGSSRESQLAFFAADSGLECALYWDLKVYPSAFDTGTRPDNIAAGVTEYSGIDTASPFDQVSTKDGTINNQETTNIDSGYKTTTYPDELIFGHAADTGVGVYLSEGAGFTPRPNALSGLDEDKVVTSTGSYAATFVEHNPNRRTVRWQAMMATFKAESGETPTFLQSNYDQVPVESYTGQPLPASSGNGNLIIATFTYYTDQPFPTSQVESVTDNKGNTYTRAAYNNWYFQDKYRTEMWYAYNIIGGGAPIIVTGHSPAFIPHELECNGQHFDGGLGTTNDVTGTNPPQPHRIGGGGTANPTSIFQLNFADGSCSVVTVTKEDGAPTLIESRGYNTCDSSKANRTERAIRASY